MTRTRGAACGDPFLASLWPQAVSTLGRRTKGIRSQEARTGLVGLNCEPLVDAKNPRCTTVRWAKIAMHMQDTLDGRGSTPITILG